MLFNSLRFAFFLPVVYMLYWLVNRKSLQLQNGLLLVASYYFYSCWDWRFLFLLIFSTFLDYYTAPTYKTYSQNLDPKQLNTTLNAIHNSIASHSNASYINLLQDTSFTKEDFYDANHLNEIGAKKLTLKVNELLKKQ